MLAACRWISGCKAVGSSAGSTTSVIGAKTKPGVSWNVSISSCQTRSMRMSVARRAVRISPPARRLPCTVDRLAHVADEDAVQPAVEPAEAGLARGLPEGRFEQVPVQPELIAGRPGLGRPGRLARRSASASGSAGLRPAKSGSRWNG